MSDELFSDEIVFADEDEDQSSQLEPWKILIIDDEHVIHSATKLALDDFVLDGRALTFHSAYSGEEGRKLLSAIPDIAVILLDVVMETDVAGLEVARFIRQDLKNLRVRIILRTGQPGVAPEKEVISNYDINDYKEKTELTAIKLFTTVTTALRAYRDLRIIDINQKGLELIINSAGRIFGEQRLQQFTSGVLTQFQSLLQLDKGSFVMQSAGFAASDEDDILKIIAGTGNFQDHVNENINESMSESIRLRCQQALANEESLFIDDAFIGYYKTINGSINLLYLNGCQQLAEVEKNLIRTFSSNVAIAYDKFYLNQEIVNTQREVIGVLGSVVESRSNDTANHVRRVSEFSALLAEKYGLPEREVSLLKLASPMHDVGKIGIPDAILNKPGKLTEEEYDFMKKHSAIGYSILKKSSRDIMKAAAIVAYEHHERWDGNGYPRGLKGMQIHEFGRITGLADVFDALISSRVYKKAFSIDRVVEIINSEKGRHFEPDLVDLFQDHLETLLEINKKLTDE